jgi:hypothetical protein
MAKVTPVTMTMTATVCRTWETIAAGMKTHYRKIVTWTGWATSATTMMTVTGSRMTRTIAP